MKRSSLFIAFCLLLVWQAQAQMKPRLPKRADGTRRQVEQITLNPIKPGIPTVADPFAPAFVPKAQSFTATTSQLQNAVVTRDPATGLPVSIIGAIDYQPLPGEGRSEALAHCYGYLETIKTQLKLSAPAQEFTATSATTDELGITHVRLQQVAKGIPVYGSEIVLHIKDGKVYMMNGRYQPTPQLTSFQAVLGQQQALDLALADVAKYTKVKSLSEAELALLDGPQTHVQLVVYPQQRKPLLAWAITLRPNLTSRWTYIVDAHTGDILQHFDNVCKVHGTHAASDHVHAVPPPDGPATANANDLFGISRTINTYQKGSLFYLIDASRSMFNAPASIFPDEPVGVIWTINAQNTSPENNNFGAAHITSSNNTWTNPIAVSAHYNAGRAFEYFKQTFNRNSINGQGGNIISLINVADASGQPMDNAFWNGAAMFYGNGNIAFSSPLAKSLDVAGHEMSHGVIQNTANLEYYAESGAINESFADVFGAMIDRDDWLIGENVVNSNVYTSGALRNMSDPHNGGNSLNDDGWQPAHFTEKYTGTADNAGVHINSGITNRAYYLFAEQVSKNTAEQVYYRALSNYLTRSSQFIDLRIAVIQAATDLHGANSAVVNAAISAFTTVGIGSGQGGDYQDDLNENPGNEYILYTDAFQEQLYLVTPQGQTVAYPLSDIGPISKPSVTDDGTIIVYVDDVHTLQAVVIDWQTGNVNQITVSSEQIWRNVAISKDGNKIAAVTTDNDNFIYVYDFIIEEWGEFELYNPTYTQGVETGDVVFADVLEWDHSGEYLAYDAFSEINTTTGTIEYWDIGFIQVWDNNAGYFSDGYIEKLFSGLPENTSVADPTFSKNSPYIIAFDFFDEYDDTYFVLAANYETGDVGEIFENIDLGYPNYSVDDTKMIFDAYDNQNNSVIGITSLAADKITSVGNPTIFISDTNGAFWGVWFANGDRVLVSDNEPISDETLAVFPNPAISTLHFSLEGTTESEVSVKVSGMLGRVLQQATIPVGADNTASLQVGNLPAGQYVVSALINGAWRAARVVVH